MGKIAKDETTTVYKMDGFEGHYEDVEGYTIGFETYFEDADPARLFEGLPDNRCQCPHWGVVLKGTLTYRYADGTEDVITGGQAYYARPGHTPLFGAGTEVIEFSPSADLAETIEVVMRNLEAAG
ncbi:MAG: cupin domain-containing protein [Acidimicrobiales bacterium]